MSSVMETRLRQGDRIAVVDDSQDDAERTMEMVIDAAYDPVAIPLDSTSIDRLLDAVAANARGLVCDHRLSHQASVPYDGAQVVAASNARGIPAVLISGYIDLDEHTSIRRHRSGIPRLLNKRFGPDDLSEALQAAELERLQGPSEDRLAYRTVVRVLSVRRIASDAIAEVIVSAWDPKQVVALPASQITDDASLGLSEIEGMRFMANVNIYAKNHQDLFFESFEIAARPPQEWLPKNREV